ncbi:MAG: HD domain-containing protein, partial [Luteimonas sp.]|nr:HD domain-containing protein [Luteimonas sp.]
MPSPVHNVEQVLAAHPAVVALPPRLRALLDEALAEAGNSTDVVLAELVDTLDSLVLLNADGEAVLATILHALPALATRLEPRLADAEPAVAALLDGQHAANQVWALHAERSGQGSAEGLRRLLLAIVRDLRVVPILLARQLAQLRMASQLPEDERRALAQLTRDIHAPLANRLGIWQLKWELEDLAFRHLDPDTYRRIARLLDDKRAGREAYIAEVTQTLREALAAQGIDGDVAGRPKHIYSIWKKMQKKDVP